MASDRPTTGDRQATDRPREIEGGVAASLISKISYIDSNYPKPSTIIHIYKALIRPITEYASEVWGYYKSDVLERGHRHFGKFILGLPSSACNAAVYGELGTFPLELRKKILMVKYW